MKLPREDGNREAPSKENGWIFHPTDLENHSRCPRKFYYQTILGLVPKGSRIHLDFGTCIHSGIGIYHSCRHIEPQEAIEMFCEPSEMLKIPKGTSLQDAGTDSFTTAKILAIKAFSQQWASLNIEGSAKKNLATGIELLNAYCDTYKDDEAKYKPDLIECHQRLKMENDTILEFTLDRVLWTEDDYICVVDSKTTGSYLSDYYWKGFANSFQLAAYDYATQKICGHCDGVQIDALHCPVAKKGKTDNFQRKTWALTELQRADWINTYEEDTDKIRKCLDFGLDDEENVLSFVTRGGACGDYSGCPYLSICQHGFKHPSIKLNFERRS